MNYFKSVVLTVALAILLVFVVKVIGNQKLIIFTVIISAIFNFMRYWFSDKIMIKISRKIETTKSEYPRLYSIVEKLSNKTGLPMPKIYILDKDIINAFVVGRNPKHSALFVTSGMLELLDDNELESFFGHELTHVKNMDTLKVTFVSSLVNVIGFLSWIALWFIFSGGHNLFELLFIVLVAPIIATIIKFAISRQIEYIADKGGAYLSNAICLADALYKASNENSKMFKMPTNAFASMLFKSNLLSSHPPIETRIKKLREMSN